MFRTKTALQPEPYTLSNMLRDMLLQRVGQAYLDAGRAASSQKQNPTKDREIFTVFGPTHNNTAATCVAASYDILHLFCFPPILQHDFNMAYHICRD